jgi:hypothetical protein
MKTIAAILLLAMTGTALAETQADQPITVYKAGKPFIYDSVRRMICPKQENANCAAPSQTGRPEAEKKPAPKGFG